LGIRPTALGSPSPRRPRPRPRHRRGHRRRRASCTLLHQDVAAQVERRSKFESSFSYFGFRRSVPGAFNVGLIGSTYTALPRGWEQPCFPAAARTRPWRRAHHTSPIARGKITAHHTQALNHTHTNDCLPPQCPRGRITAHHTQAFSHIHGRHLIPCVCQYTAVPVATPSSWPFGV